MDIRPTVDDPGPADRSAMVKAEDDPAVANSAGAALAGPDTPQTAASAPGNSPADLAVADVKSSARAAPGATPAEAVAGTAFAAATVAWALEPDATVAANYAGIRAETHAAPTLSPAKKTKDPPATQPSLHVEPFSTCEGSSS